MDDGELDKYIVLIEGYINETKSKFSGLDELTDEDYKEHLYDKYTDELDSFRQKLASARSEFESRRITKMSKVELQGYINEIDKEIKASTDTKEIEYLNDKKFSLIETLKWK